MVNTRLDAQRAVFIISESAIRLFTVEGFVGTAYSQELKLRPLIRTLLECTLMIFEYASQLTLVSMKIEEKVSTVW